MSEQSVAQARASVMLYNNERREWEHSGGSQGLSRVHVYHHPINNTYRIVGRKVNDHSVVINCALAKGLKYNEATPTFHQWRDQRQVYGLNFPSKEDAQVFGQAVASALENLRSGVAASIPQQQTTHQHAPPSHMSNGRGYEAEEMPPQGHYDAHERDQYSRVRVAPAGPDRSHHNQYDARESSSSSTVSFSMSSGPPPIAQSVPTAPPVPAAPPAPPVPPAPPALPAAPPLPGGGGGGPPAPPAPPPPPAPSGGGGSLADQIAAAKLKKASKVDNEAPRLERSNSSSRGGKGPGGGGGGMDMMAEMQRKLAARKAKEEGREIEPVREEAESKTISVGGRSSVSAPPPAPAVGNNNVKTNFLTPAKPANNGGIRKSSKGETSFGNDQLEELKSELLAEFRQELDAAKKEIIEAVRQEIARLR